ISEKGVVFNYDNKKYDFIPEKSIKIQEDLGADIIFAFDECTSPLHDHFYTKKSMERTHRWAVRSLNAHKKKNQALFGIVQGGVFEDLRKKSSKFIGGLPFDGFGIGGSFGEKQMKDVLRWSLSGLPEEKPRHLLGIGKIKDIFIAVKEGIDLFDCVIPTREARHGILYVKSGKFAIEKGIFAGDKKLIDGNCGCFVCRNKITRKELHCYFKSARKADNKKLSTCDVDRLVLGKRLATIHNIHFFKNLFGEIREAIADGKLDKLEREYLF
ncbi:MAG: tRNA guanosine(34) transglycosylase Tgt, partial [Patescibacteria group bacterium]